MLLNAHADAIQYDLITLTHYNLKQLGGELDWATLRAFLGHLPPSSALVRELEPDMARWLNGNQTAFILADISDQIQAFNLGYIQANSKTRQRNKLEKYPRPVKIDTDSEKKIGAGAIPIKDFDEWWSRGE